MLIAFLRVEVMANTGPLAQGGLNEALGLAVGAGSVGTGEAVLDAELEAGGAEVAGTIAGAVVGEQAALYRYVLQFCVWPVGQLAMGS